jgi:hypothetical protein
MKTVMRTGFVRVAASQSDRIYNSIDELPEPLRDRVRRVLSGPDSTTIMIADSDAYDWIAGMDEDVAADLEQIHSQELIEQPQPSRSKQPKPTTRDPTADREWKVLLFAGGGAILALWALWLWAIRSGM